MSVDARRYYNAAEFAESSEELYSRGAEIKAKGERYRLFPAMPSTALQCWWSASWTWHAKGSCDLYFVEVLQSCGCSRLMQGCFRSMCSFFLSS